MKNVISQSLGLFLVNINVYAKVNQNIPLSSRVRAIFTFSEFEPQPVPNDSWQPLGLCLVSVDAYAKFYQNIPNGLGVINIFHEQTGDKIFTNSPRTKSSQTVLSGDKIKCLIIGHSMKFNFKFHLTFLGSCNSREGVHFWLLYC